MNSETPVLGENKENIGEGFKPLSTVVGIPMQKSDELEEAKQAWLAERKEAAENLDAAENGENANGSAHYESDVRHYARYDKVDSGYSDETRKSLTYASRTPFGRFFLDLILILTRPGAFWKGQAEHPATIGQMYWPHLIILISLRTIAVMGGALLQYAMNDISPAHLLIEAGVQALMIFLMIWLFSLLISGISTLSGAGFQFDRAHRFAGYCMTPIFIVGILSVLPLPYMDKICDIIAMPWAFLVMGAGVIPFLKIKPELGPTLTGLFCGMMLCLWGLIPMLIPRLIGILL